ncbi:uncharacterized protein STEHIDRAFT_120670 [Stereum hirsutum FP-91666 SS1]|uniref:uncharacterized protein n=1 Tax=Stereum hirsutum (strain FP-91666) TaxID=721885 RepID=UPI000440AA0D|nr:uncharacterized protein STEHIDRAFT_120670 [Stereum hirsutum FP-91666 SS1]EIM88512.1 hypothetical protein STEHIDRAFT_120670 [Stereum hirsutum FP-91666 SS1]
MFTVLAPVFLAASVLASPALITRQTPAGCQSFPTDGAWNVDNFTLSALLEDDTQKPLALSGNDTTFTLATTESISSPQGTNFTMVSSAVTAPVMSNNDVAKAANTVTDGGFLTFATSQDDSASAVDSYCELYNTDPNGSIYPYPLLAVNGYADGFSLCDSTNDSQVNVVFNASQDASSTGYDYSTCVPVHLLMVQDEQ